MKIILLVLIILSFNFKIHSQDNGSASDFPSDKVWGLAFGDYFYKAGGDSTVSTLQYTAYKKDFNNLDFRRVFLGYNHNFNADFMAKIVLAYEGTDLTNEGKRAVNLKDAALLWKNIFTYSSLTFGLFPTPGFSYNSERFWGYRSVERTIMDQRGILSSRDMGVMLNGSFDKKDEFGYMGMIGTGSGQTLEKNKYKKFYALLFGNFFDKKFFADVYTDYEPYGSDKSKTTWSAFLGFMESNFTCGIEPFFSVQKNFNTNIPTKPGNIEPFGVSFFTSGKLPGDKFKFFARYDYYNPDTRTAQYGYVNHFVTAGLDYMPIANIHIMPNIWLNAYQTKNAATQGRVSDVVPRITFNYDYR